MPLAALPRCPQHRCHRDLNCTPVECSQAKLQLAGVVALTLATTGVSVAFNFLGRDFFNALSEKNVDQFYHQLWLYLGAFVVGIPVFVFRDYFQSTLTLKWRGWMMQHLLTQYMADRTYFRVQSGALVDNPDQRVTSDVRVRGTRARATRRRPEPPLTPFGALGLPPLRPSPMVPSASSSRFSTVRSTSSASAASCSPSTRYAALRGAQHDPTYGRCYQTERGRAEPPFTMLPSAPHNSMTRCACPIHRVALPFDAAAPVRGAGGLLCRRHPPVPQDRTAARPPQLQVSGTA